MNKDQTFFYEDIEELAEEWGGLDIDNYGPEIIGRNIVVVIGLKEQVATFVLDGTMNAKFTYKLVFYQN